MSSPVRLTGKRFLQFLQQSKGKRSSASVVLGNESGDLDSSVSSLIYSFFLSETGDKRVLPVLNYPAQDIVLRPEVIAVLSKDVSVLDYLTFSDQVDLSDPEILDVSLVDHNRLATSQSFLAPLVHTVIDHHEDESIALKHIKGKKIEIVGSACTLITEIILNTSTMDAVISRMLLSAILSDTFNLSLPNERTFAKDREMAHKLATLIQPNQAANEVFETIFQFVEKEKFNTSSLSSTDLLRKDYKQWTLMKENFTESLKMGISAVPLSFKEWCQRDKDFVSSFQSHFATRELDILFVMTISHDPEFNRELGVFVNGNNPLFNAVDAELLPLVLSRLSFPNLGAPSGTNVSFYSIDIQYSRKKLSPKLSAILKEKITK